MDNPVFPEAIPVGHYPAAVVILTPLVATAVGMEFAALAPVKMVRIAVRTAVMPIHPVVKLIEI